MPAICVQRSWDYIELPDWQFKELPRRWRISPIVCYDCWRDMVQKRIQDGRKIYFNNPMVFLHHSLDFHGDPRLFKAIK
eukprot:530314-Amphidinium_carterae.1